MKSTLGRRLVAEWWVVGIGLVLVGLMVGGLFGASPRLFVTPDYGLSDIWNYHFPMKVLLDRALNEGRLPWWNSQIGTGMPVMAQGQMGAWYPVNWLLYGLLPIWLAWNMTYVVVMIMCYGGVYVWGRSMGLSRWGAVIAAVGFSFSSGVVLHMTNPPLLAALSWMPWLWWMGEKLRKKPSKKMLGWLGLGWGLQLLAGYFQVVFMTTVGLVVGWVTANGLEKRRLIDGGGWLVASWLVGVLVAAVQLVPTWELVGESGRGLVANGEVEFCLAGKQWLSWLVPEYWGTVADGSYPKPDGEWGIYWESTYFISVTGLVLAGLGVWRKRKEKRVRVVAVTLGVIVILAMGKKGPLAFMYELPGFAWFRIPGRFMLVGSMMVAGLAGWGSEWLLAEKKLPSWMRVVVVGLMSFELLSFGRGYHPTAEVERVLEKPVVVRAVGERRIYTSWEQKQLWSKEFETDGWKNAEVFVDMLGGLDANVNVIWKVNQVGFYGILIPGRLEKMWQVDNSSVLAAAGTEVVISPKGMGEKQSKLEYEIEELRETSGRWRLVDEYVVAGDSDEAIAWIQEGKVEVEKVAVLERGLEMQLGEMQEGRIEMLYDEAEKQELDVEVDVNALLVVADTFYPGWRAWVDDEEKEIMAANGAWRAVVVPSGNHRVVFEYEPDWQMMSVMLSVLGVGLGVGLIEGDGKKGWRGNDN